MTLTNYMLSQEQKSELDINGFTIIKNALDKNLLNNIINTVDVIYNQNEKATQENFLHIFDFFNRDPIFLNLISNPRVLHPIIDLLGWNIYMYHAHLDVNPPLSINDSLPPLTWHRDNSRMNYEFGNGTYPRITLKASFWLSDVSETGRGNLYVLPGSHLANYSDLRNKSESYLSKFAIPILANAGDIVIFDNRLWHTRSNNISDLTRKVIFIGYGFRWLRPRDNVLISKSIYDQSNSIEKQLVNRDIAMSAYDPHEADVPLKQLFDELHC